MYFESTVNASAKLKMAVGQQREILKGRLGGHHASSANSANAHSAKSHRVDGGCKPPAGYGRCS